MSVPRLARPIPVATAIALPPLEPPGIRVGSCGLRACGLVTPSANSCVEVLPRITAPAERHRSTASASSAGRRVVGVRAAAGADAADVDDVLDRDRDAVQRSAAAAGAQFGVADAGLGQRVLGEDLDERRPLVLRDVGERLLGELDARGLCRPRAPARRRRSRRVFGMPAERGSGVAGGPKTSYAGRRCGGSTTCAPSRSQRGVERGGGDAHGSRPFLLEHAREQLAHAAFHDLCGALDVHAHQRGGGVGAAGADRLEDLQVLLDRRLDPVRRREVVDADQADALVDVADVALASRCCRTRARSPRGRPRRRRRSRGRRRARSAGPATRRSARPAPRGRRSARRGPRARRARRRARASPTRAAGSGAGRRSGRGRRARRPRAAAAPRGPACGWSRSAPRAAPPRAAARRGTRR